MSQFRECGDCSACCSWLTAEVYGWEIGCGKACRFLENGKCSIYKARDSVCRKYQCAWTQHLLPEEMRPDKCNIIVSVEIENNIQYLKVIPINNKKIDSKTKKMFEEWSEKMNTPVVILDNIKT